MGAGAPSAWTPADITTQLWLDFADAANRTIESSAFSLISDKSGNANNFGQATSGKRPALDVGGLNGTDFAEFNGSSHALVRGSNNNIGRNVGTLAFAFVCRPDVVNADRRVFNSSTGASSTAARLLLGFNTSSRWRVGGRRTDAGSFAENTAVTAASGSWVIVVAEYNYASATLAVRVNGAQQSSAAFLDAGTTSNTDSIQAAIGSNPAGDQFYFDGGLADIVVAPSLAHTEKIEGWLAHKRGLAGLLPSGHPYKSAPP